MAGSVMGIQIGSRTIKILETVKKGNKQIVKKFSLVPTPEECINDGVMSNMEPIRKAIAKELRSKKYKAKKVICIVESSTIIIRTIEMEKKPEKVIRQLLEIKTQDFLPIQYEQYQIDFKILEEIEEEGLLKNKVLLVATPNTVVLPLARLLKDLKLTPILISIPSECLENIFCSKGSMIHEKPGNIMFLDIGGDSITVTIIAEDKACLTRRIEYGVENLMDHIKQSTSELNDRPYDEEEYLDPLIRPQVEYNIIAEIERILQFYYSSYGHNSIEKIYLIGGGANIKGIKEYMEEAFNIEAEKLNHFDTVAQARGVDFESYAGFFVTLLGAINGL